MVFKSTGDSADNDGGDVDGDQDGNGDSDDGGGSEGSHLTMAAW